MREYKLNEYDAAEEANGQNLPQKISVWSKIKNFLFQEIDLKQALTLKLTPKEEKVLTEVHDFLFQEVKFPELHDFLFQEVHIFGKKKDKVVEAGAGVDAGAGVEVADLGEPKAVGGVTTFFGSNGDVQDAGSPESKKNKKDKKNKKQKIKE